MSIIKGRVYKNLQNTSLLRTVVYNGTQNVIMMNVDQDNTQTVEFDLDDAGGDYHVTVGSFAASWEDFGEVDILDQVNAYLATRDPS